MRKLLKSIFGKIYKFTCNDEKFEILRKSLELYPDTVAENADVCVNISTVLPQSKFVSRNPSIFVKMQNGMITKFPQCEILWERNTEGRPLMITVDIPKPSQSLRAGYHKFRTMEYSTEVEIFEQVLHELVLVPSVYFFKDLSLVHAAVLAVNGRAIMLAGTGGTGKTSALLSLRKKENVSFVSDDIAIVSKNGFIYPNLAWPKIYGYNLSSYITKEELLEGRGIVDRLQFNLRLKRNPRFVRRKLQPNVLYTSFEDGPVPIQKVIYLFRHNSEMIELKDLEKDLAIEMGLHVMQTEYSNFHNFLEWDQYNSIVTGVRPLLKVNEVLKNWQSNLSNSFKNADIKLLQIPFNLKHEKYLDYINRVLINGKL